MGGGHAGYLHDIKGEYPLTPQIVLFEKDQKFMFFPERTKGLCSFSLTEEKKEPKETVTPSPFKGDVNRETQKPTFLCNVLVSRDDGLYLIIHRVVPRYQNIKKSRVFRVFLF